MFTRQPIGQTGSSQAIQPRSIRHVYGSFKTRTSRGGKEMAGIHLLNLEGD